MKLPSKESLKDSGCHRVVGRELGAGAASHGSLAGFIAHSGIDQVIGAPRFDHSSN